MPLPELRDIGRVRFSSSNQELNDGFMWAEQQALAYVHPADDPVGPWYEAALPGRNAFCMRDAAHHSAGAAVLGLQEHTRNMFRRFAENISAARGWCSYWEITGSNEPAAVDYTDDRDFWYNLPANFDVLQACYRQYLWTGDEAYLKDPIFLHFYQKTVFEYARFWDSDGDGLLDHRPENGRRGLASYNEEGLQPLVGGDMISAQYAGYRAYAEILDRLGRKREAEDVRALAEGLRDKYQTNWWDGGTSRFYGALRQDRSFEKSFCKEGNFLALYFDIVDDVPKLRLALADLERRGATNAEGKSYLPDIYYRYGENEAALRSLKELLSPELERREYPEVSFCAVGAFATGLMGIRADGCSTIATCSALADALDWAEIGSVPILGRSVTVKHEARIETEFVNESGAPLFWKAEFPVQTDSLLHNGTRVRAQQETGPAGEPRSYLTVRVRQGEKQSVGVPR